MESARAYFTLVGVGFAVPTEVEGGLAGPLEDEAGEGAGVGVGDELAGLSFLSPAAFSPVAGSVCSVPVGGLSLSE